MTVTLERLVSDATYPVLKPVYAHTECARCWRTGRVEWLPDGTVRVLHRGLDGNHLCILQLPPLLLPNDTTEVGRALLLLR